MNKHKLTPVGNRPFLNLFRVALDLTTGVLIGVGGYSVYKNGFFWKSDRFQSQKEQKK